ncbi:MAG: hypothetical protein GX640_24145, partial [Fibrobacter sp.]|nr:hypothetical protein [Fibrobacter sp.]
LVTGTFKVYRSFSESAEREKIKAQLQRDIITVTENIERDIRMSGLGLPGNGLAVSLSDSSSDSLMIFQNSSNASTRITSAVSGSHIRLLVENGAVFNNAKWVCCKGSVVEYKKVARIGMNSTGADTIYLSDPVGYTLTLGVDSLVYPADAIGYYIRSDSISSLVRYHNGLSVALSNLIDTLNITPRDKGGNKLTASANATLVSIVMGGRAGKSAKDPLIADSTEVNIRNGF